MFASDFAGINPRREFASQARISTTSHERYLFSVSQRPAISGLL